MRFVSSVIGTAAIRASADDTSPRGGILQKRLIEFVGEHYKFSTSPTTNPGAPQLPILQFQAGEFGSEKGTLPILHLVIAIDGDAVVASDTDSADAILTDYMTVLDKEFSYRFMEANPPRLHASALVAEFDSNFVEKTAAFRTIQNVINNEIDKGGRRYKLKRLGFGIDGSNDMPLISSVEQIIPLEFSIERRANEPLDKNRFFCRAPLTTSEHIRVLEMVERAVIG